ncbi:uncharacterized protein [Nicotiana sylvestris]|uniref:uncharacterized protein n=1 Tax=Nicotiana sylvestris TaxID=4096 RepID=UPI00388C8902
MSGSEYEPSQEISSDSIPEYIPDWLGRHRLRDTPPPSPTSQTSTNVSSGSSEGSTAGSVEYFTSPTTLLSGEGAEGGEEEVQGNEEVAEEGEPQLGGFARTRKPKLGRIDANEHLVKEFYCDVSHIKKGSKVTKVQNLKVLFDGKSINEYLGSNEEDKTLYMAMLEMGEERDDNPKSKNYKAPASAPTGQFEESAVVEVPDEPTSTLDDIPPGPSTSIAILAGPSTSAGLETASSKLSILTTIVEAQSVPPAPQIPQSIDKALKELAREHKKPRKTRASKESVKELRADVDRLKAYQLPLDLLLEDPVPVAQPQQEQTQRPPNRRRMIPRADDAIIQLADPPETSSSQPEDVLVPEPVEFQAQVLVAEEQTTGNQFEVPKHTEDPGTTHDPMQTDKA